MSCLQDCLHDVNHLPLLEYVATRKPVILSTGLATLSEIERALDVLKTRSLAQ
jgi:sialic acid synthase SpsE